jgi:hypothetical protein
MRLDAVPGSVEVHLIDMRDLPLTQSKVRAAMLGARTSAG